MRPVTSWRSSTDTSGLCLRRRRPRWRALWSLSPWRSRFCRPSTGQRGSTSGSIKVGSRAPGSWTICTCTSCRGGAATTASSRSWATRACFPRISKPRTIASRAGSVTDRDDLTPMMRQYRDLKRRYPDHVLLFRLGDFYETFFEDAELASRLLQITLTARQGAPMAGIPHHAADGYVARLVHAGQKIAVCEQLEAPGREKKLLRRDVVRIITPGTLTDTAYLEGAANNFLMAVTAGRDSTGVALVDVSTGEFWAGEDAAKETEVLATALLRRPAEVVVPDSAREDPALLARLQATGAALTFCDPQTFAPRRAAADLCAHFRVESLAAFGVADLTAGLGAAAAALAYLRATQGEALGHLTRLARLTAADAMVLDETAVVTLELLASSSGSARESLFGVLDATVTPMGARLLRQWLLRPLLDPVAIAARQTAVGAMVEAPEDRKSV